MMVIVNPCILTLQFESLKYFFADTRTATEAREWWLSVLVIRLVMWLLISAASVARCDLCPDDSNILGILVYI